MSIINAIASNNLTNKAININQVPNGRNMLHACLMALQERLPGQRAEIQEQAAMMRHAVGAVLNVGLREFDLLCRAWNVTVHVWGSLETTNIFVIKMSERNACPRDFEFRFARLG